MNTKTHTDIKREGWIQRLLPPFLRPFATLARLDRPIGVWLLLLPGWWSIVLASGGVTRMDGKEWKIFALFAIGAVVMRAAGCVVNDLWDRDLDKQVGRTNMRPLASGDVSVKQALGFLAVLLLIGFVILLQMNFLTIVLGILSLPLIVIYPLMKRFTWWPQLMLGIVFNFGALMGWSAVMGGIGLPAVLLYIAGIFWTLGYDTIYAHQDLEDDALVGIKSTARLFGAKSKLWVMSFYVVAGLFIVLSSARPEPHSFYVRDTALIVAGLMNLRSLFDWNPDDQESSLLTFKKARNFGLLILAAMAISA